MLKGIDPLPSPEMLRVLCEMGYGDEQCRALARFDFHDCVAGACACACAIVQTGERKAWSNFMFKKGVIAGELRP